MTKQILILGLDRDARRTLLALYELAAQDGSTPAGTAGLGSALARRTVRVDPAGLAHRLHTSPNGVMRSLRLLESRGLVWAERCRLTLQGLATAAQLAALRARAGARGSRAA